MALRPLALPAEHGGWGFLAEAILLGLVLAPSTAGAAIGVAALGAFLARHPLKLAAADGAKGVRYPRTVWAERFALAYGALALAAVATAFATSSPSFWIPLAAATPLGLAQLAYDVRGHGRELTPEMAGSVALGGVASSILLAAGWPGAPALAVWLIVAVRAVGAVLYVRSRLRLDRGFPAEASRTWASHVVGVALAVLLAAAGWAPWLAVAAFAALLLRAAKGLSPRRRPTRPQVVGLQEMAFGFLTVVLLILGYALEI